MAYERERPFDYWSRRPSSRGWIVGILANEMRRGWKAVDLRSMIEEAEHENRREE